MRIADRPPAAPLLADPRAHGPHHALATVLAFVLPVLVVAAAINWALPDRYQAAAVLLPQVPFNPTAGISAQLGGPQLNVDASRLSRLTGTSVFDRYKIILNSRSVSESVATALRLNQRDDWLLWAPLVSTAPPSAGASERQRMAATISQLRRQVRVQDTKEGSLLVSADAPDAQIAAALANAYVEQLDRFLNRSVLSAVKKGRLFIESQLRKARAQLTAAEEALRVFQARHRAVALPEQTRAAVEASSRIAADIADAEVTLGVKTTYLTEQDAEVLQLRQRLAELRQQQQQLINGDRARSFQLPLSQVPSVAVELARLQRDVLTQEKVYALLTEQYELAKIIESREDVSFQIVDPATPPVSPAGPSRLRDTAAAGLLALLAAALYLSIRRVTGITIADDAG